MKKYCLTLLLALASPLFALADDAPARPDIDELFSVMRVEKSMQSVMEQMKQMLPQMVSNIAKQSNLPLAEIEKTKGMQDKMFALIVEEMSWKKMKGDMTKIYAESLTPEEVKGITAFYKSPAGQAFLDKMPLIMQKSMEINQKKMMELMPKIQAMVQSEMEAKEPKK